MKRMSEEERMAVLAAATQQVDKSDRLGFFRACCIAIETATLLRAAEVCRAPVDDPSYAPETTRFDCATALEKLASEVGE